MDPVVRISQAAGIYTTRIGSVSVMDTEHRTELDSHADTSVVGNDTALIIHDFERPVQVHGYDGRVSEDKHCKIVSAAVAYDHPATGETFMLLLHQAILIPHMKVNLLSPMQVRANDIAVNDEPKSMVLNPSDDHHAIVVPPQEPNLDGLRIPLSIRGVISYVTTRKPTIKEYEQCPEDHRIELTYESPEWDPSTTRFEEQEARMVDSSGALIEQELKPRAHQIAAFHQLDHEVLDDSLLYDALMMRCDATLASVQTQQREWQVGPTSLAQTWGIGLQTAKRTLDVTTQRGIRTVLHPTLSRRFRTNDRQLRYRRLSHDMFTDTMEASIVSWHRQNRYAQVFATRFGWVRAFPMKRKSDAHEALSLMAHRDGVPPAIIMDGSKEQTMGEFRKTARSYGIAIRQTEPYSPWQNAAEWNIREVKRAAGRKMAKTHCPKKLWDHCIELEGYIRSHTALDIYELNGQVPETVLSGQTADISPFVECSWYEWVKYYDSLNSYPDGKEVLGRWLGPSLDVGPAMTAKILRQNGHVIHRSTWRRLTQAEIDDPGERVLRDTYDAEISKRLGSSVTVESLTELDADAVTPEYQLYQDDVEPESKPAPDVDDVTPEDLDTYVGASVNLPIGGTVKAGTVKHRARNADGELIGKQNDNPILDTRIYQVEFPDGEVAEYAANVIAENMFAQCDPNGNQYLLLKSIIDHATDGTALTSENRFVTVNGRQCPRKTSRGWKLCVEWQDGSTSWERLSEVKASYPVEVAEYAIAKKLEAEPAFAWWVPYVNRRRDRIIAAIAKRYLKTTHKFGFEIPKTVERALEIDRENGNHLWRDAIAKEMEAVRVAFQILLDGKEPPPGYQFMRCHMIFTIKLEGFRRKARLVAGGHMTEQPAVMTYASVVSRETVRIALTIAALNDLEVKAADIQNAYLTAPCEEKIFTILGAEFGPDQGKKAIIVRALYGLKSAGASFGRHLADCMRTLGYKPCLADADLWFKPVVRPDDGFKCYSYILIYVDDILAIHHDATKALCDIDKFFPMKKGSIGDPDIYLGAKLRQVQLNNGVYAWGMSSSKYVQEAVRNTEAYLQQHFGGRKLPKRATAPWPTDYSAELDVSPELTPKQASYYQSQIGILHWMVELGRVDIIVEVSMLASHMALPREGHLDAIFHIFGYLKNKHNARMVFDPTYPTIDKDNFQVHDWKDFYGDVKEALPPNAPEPYGKEVDLRLFVDSDHAGDKRTRRSRTGFFVFLNSSPIVWMSKKQATIETSVFGAEFVAMKHGIETVRGIRFKLRMMGVPIAGPTYVYGDNMSVIHNTQRPESTLKRKCNQICYHAIRESVAMGECLTGHIASVDNPADLATKIIGRGQRRDHLVDKLLYDLTASEEMDVTS